MSLTLLNTIYPGDKLEIYYINKLNEDVMLSTQVYDVTSNEELLIHNPLREGKLYMVALNETMTFYAKRPDYGVITFKAVLLNRKKMGNVYTIVCKMTSDLVKQQRRSFYRVKLYEDVGLYFMVDAQMTPVNYYIFDPDAVNEEQVNMKVSLLDISGGGIGLKSNVPLPVGTYVYASLDFLEKPCEISGVIVRSIPSKKYPDEFDIGMSFGDLSGDVRRRITAFVFTRQQQARRKEIDNG